MIRVWSNGPFQRFRLIFLSAAAVAVCSVGSASAQEESTDDAILTERAIVLVEQLGSDEFSQREEATERLVEMGFAAEAAIEQGTHHLDREIRYRCERIHRLIIRKDRQEKLEAFLAGTLNDDADALPGWSSFQDVIGDDQKSRELFVIMLEEEWELLRIFQDRPEDAADVLTGRCQSINDSIRIFRKQVSLGSVCTLVFVAGEPDVEAPDLLGSFLYSFCLQAAFRAEIEGGSRQAMTKKLLGRWIGRTGASSFSYQTLMLAMRFDLEEGIEPAESILQQEGVLRPHIKQCALLAIAQLGNEEEHAALIEDSYDDETSCSRQNQNGTLYETQLRDVALACRIHLAGENPRQYGFDRIQPNSQMVYNTSTLGFENDEKRQESFDSWSEAVQSREDEAATPEE